MLFEDADIAVVLKPSGWICTPAGVDSAAAALPLQQRGDALLQLQAQVGPAPVQQYLVLRYGPSVELCRDPAQQCGLVHRLDLETSGLVLVGKTRPGFERARAQLRSRNVIKDFVALVHGSLGARKCGECRAPIDDSLYASQAVCRVHASGRDAVTVYECLGEYSSPQGDAYSLLHLRLITGRTHQVRVHMAHIGHPVVSDGRYLGSAALLEKDREFCPRLFLHKVRIGFHTLGGEPIVVWSPLTMAPELLQALGQLKGSAT